MYGLIDLVVKVMRKAFSGCRLNFVLFYGFRCRDDHFKIYAC
jgi:hypothetical protein